MAVAELTAASEQRVSAGVDRPAPPAFTPRTVSAAEWLAAFVETALATVPVDDIHALVDQVAARRLMAVTS